MAVFTKIREMNWTAITAEVALIFLGITLALAFDNLSTKREDRRREAQVLSELRAALESDLRDIGRNLEEDSLTLAAIGQVLDHLEAGRPYSADLAPAFGQAAGFTTLIPNRAAYEHLKVVGLDLTQDDGLRQAITSYYERQVQGVKLLEEIHVDPLWRDQMNPMMLRLFRYTERKEPASPLNYGALLLDEEYRNLLRHTQWAIGLKDGLYVRLASTGDSLVSVLAQHDE